MEKIEASGWEPMRDSAAVATVPERQAQLKLGHRRPPSTELDTLITVARPWLQENVVPAVNLILERKRKQASQGEKRRYGPTTANEFLAFFLQRSMLALLKHAKHDLPPDKISSVSSALLSEHRAKVLHAALDLGDHTLKFLYSTLPTLMAQFLVPGTVSGIDEDIVAHYGRVAHEQAKLINIPGKPFDLGLIEWLLAQRLLFTGLPVVWSACPGFLGGDATPIDAAIYLLDSLPRTSTVYIRSSHMVADSLWSAPSHIDRFRLLGIPFTVAIKSHNTFLPSGLIDLAGNDLPPDHSRTYTDGTFVLQVSQSDRSVTALLTSAWTRSTDRPPKLHPRCSYATAKVIYAKESPESVVELFGLDPEWLKKPLSLLVHHVTGWDILRPEAEQGSDDVLTFDAASKPGRRGLPETHQQRLHLKKPAKKLSIAKLLAELFPREAREHDSVAHKRRAELRQQQVRDLATIRERVLVNRLTKKKNFASHSVSAGSRPCREGAPRLRPVGTLLECHRSCQRGLPRILSTPRRQVTANGWALQTLCHHIFMNARAMWEEHRAAHAYHASGQSIAAAEAVPQHTIPQYLLSAAEQARDRDLQLLS